jgi:hypothetical protein
MKTKQSLQTSASVALFVTLVESEVGRGTEVTVALPVEGYSR